MNTPFKQSNILNKALSILLGVLILISIVMLVWSWNGKKENMMKETNTSSTKTEQKKEDIIEVDTSDWLTYRNEEYGFEFRYPRNMEIGERESYVVIVNIPHPEPAPAWLQIDIYKGRVSKELTEESMKRDTFWADQQNRKLEKIENIQFGLDNKIIGKQIRVFAELFGQLVKEIYWENQQYTFSTLIRTGVEGYDPEGLVYGVLQTFKFTE